MVEVTKIPRLRAHIFHHVRAGAAHDLVRMAYFTDPMIPGIAFQRLNYCGVRCYSGRPASNRSYPAVASRSINRSVVSNASGE
jgi:hypothetical protein